MPSIFSPATPGAFANSPPIGRLLCQLALSFMMFLPLLCLAAEQDPQSSSFKFSPEVLTRQALVQTSMGRAPADLLLQDLTVLNVFTAQWLPHHDIVIQGKRIAWVGPTGTWPGKAKNSVKLSGRWAVPGFGESHKHIESTYLTPEYEAALVIPDGNTWTVEGSHELSNVVGDRNADFWLKAEQAGSPLKIFPAIGSATPPTAYERGGGYYGYKEMDRFLNQDLRVVALGEVMDWSAVSNADNPGHERLWQMMQATWDNRGVIEGHGSGLRDRNTINAFAAAGLSSDHEVRQVQEGILKLHAGVFLEVRVDTARILFPKLLTSGLADWSNISVTTDDRDVHATLELGSMDYNIRTAIEAGVPPITAYQMGSYNTARHFNIDHLVGAIAPGRYADVVVLENPTTVKIDRVYANGQLAAKGDEYLLDIPSITYPDWAHNTMNVGRTLTAKDFVISAPPQRETVNVALMEPFWFAPRFISDTMPVSNGRVHADPAREISKVAVIDRYHGNAKIARMFWRGVGPKTPQSALASSQSHDLHNIWSVGNDDAAMALAANSVAAQGGGWALVANGEVVASVRLEIAGLMSQRPVQKVAAEMEALLGAADRMEWIRNPGLPDRMRFAFLTASPWKWQLVAPYEGNPGGFVDVSTGEIHPTVW